MKKTIGKILLESLFFKLFILFMAVWTYIIISEGNNAFLLRINDGHSPFLDIFFKYATYLGGGIATLCIGVFLMCLKIRWGVMAIVSFLGSAIITQVLKRWGFDWPRPKVVFHDQLSELHLVEGVELHTQFTFPSGHSTAAFAVFFLLSLITFEKKYLGFLFGFLAIVAGFSRCYLMQHFPLDVLVGSCIGFSASLFTFAWLKDKKLGNWGDKSLFSKST